MTEPVLSIAPPRSMGWHIWDQYRRSKTQVAALWVIGLLVLSAIYAPLVSSSQPFVWCEDASGCSLPWLRGLYFNSNVFESGIDLFFNLLMIALPVGLIVQLGITRFAPRERKITWRRWGFSGLWALVLASFFALLLWQPRHALTDYVGLADQAKFAWFPPLRMQYADVLFGTEGTGMRHLLGMDTSGRDVFVRMIFGTRTSLAVGVIAVGIYIAIGIVVGSIAGFYGGWIDLLSERTLEIFLCFPTFFLILTFISFLDQPSIVWVMVFIGVVGWTGPARLVRGEFLRLRSLDFVVAARALGLSNRRIIFGHILPNALSPVLVAATFGIASAVIVESTLSFLGIGDPVLPSWGRLLALGRATGDIRMMLLAGMLIFVTVSALNMAGEGLRDAMDPKLRR